MKVDVRIKNRNWKKDMKEAAMNTINRKWHEGKELTEELLMKYMISEHSPIRGVELRITLHNIPYHNSVHFARHVHSIPYVTTHRPDRTGKPRSIDDTCTHIFDINIQGLIDMARKRLCIGKCDKTTFGYMKGIKERLAELGGLYRTIGVSLVPNCVYRNDCPEFKPCSFFESNNLSGSSIIERYKKYNNLILK